MYDDRNERIAACGGVLIILAFVSLPVLLFSGDLAEHLELIDKTPRYCGDIYDKDMFVYFTYIYIEETTIMIPHYSYYFDVHDLYSGCDVHVSVYSHYYNAFNIGDNITIFQSGRVVLND